MEAHVEEVTHLLDGIEILDILNLFVVCVFYLLKSRINLRCFLLRFFLANFLHGLFFSRDRLSEALFQGALGLFYFLDFILEVSFHVEILLNNRHLNFEFDGHLERVVELHNWVLGVDLGSLTGLANGHFAHKADEPGLRGLLVAEIANWALGLFFYRLNLLRELQWGLIISGFLFNRFSKGSFLLTNFDGALVDRDLSFSRVGLLSQN
jgi:hypothetical protein